MPSLLTTVTLEALTATDETVVNNFAFHSAVAIDAAVILDIHNAVAGFYNTLPATGTRAVGKYLSPTLDRASASVTIRSYDITGILGINPATGRPYPHGSPIAEDNITLTTSDSTDALPSQVACVLTLRGRDAIEQAVEGPGNIRPRQRRTGRLYIGPLNIAAETNSVNGHSRPVVTFRDDLLLAAEELQDALVDGSYAWCVWSRADGAMYPIERVECDDSWDVIRSRKLDPTVRNVRTFTPEPALVLGA